MSELPTIDSITTAIDAAELVVVRMGMLLLTTMGFVGLILREATKLRRRGRSREAKNRTSGLPPDQKASP